MEVTVKKIGNSLGIILNKRIVKELDIKEGDVVEIKIEKKLPLKVFGIVKKRLDLSKVKEDTKKNEKW